METATEAEFNVKSSHYSRIKPYIAFSLASLYVFYEFYLRVMPSAMTHELMRDFDITASGLGFLTALFYYGYTPMQIPAGLLFDRYGPRILLTLACGICAISSLLFGVTDSYFIASTARLAIGFASAFAFVGALVVASRSFDAKYFAFATGIVQLTACIGAIGGEAPIAAIVEHIGWRDTMWWSAIAGFVFTAMIWFMVEDNPEHKAAKKLEKKQNELEKLKEVLRKPQMWAVAVYAFACWTPVTVFAALWGVPFLTLLYHTSTTAAATAVAAIWIGIALGSPLFGWWSDRIHNRRIPMAICSLLTIVTSIIVVYAPPMPLFALYFVLFFYGVSASSQVISFGLVQDINPAHVRGTAVGFNNMAVIAGGMTIQPLIGLILNWTWAGHIAHGIRLYSLSNYRTGLVMIPLCGLLGLLTLLFIKETHCKPQY